jgi:predicted Zn-dependent peptidase
LQGFLFYKLNSMLDRKTPPISKTIHQLDILHLVSQTLSNGIKCHTLKAGVQEVFKMEIIFPAGSYYEQKSGAAFFMVKMLGEGTQSKTSSQISESIDQLGGFIEFNHGLERLSISIMGLSRYLRDFFLILEELIHEPSFPEKELPQLKTMTLQNLQVSLEKNAYLASIKFKELLFGENHPYGKQIQPEEVDSINREDLITHYQNYIFQKPFDFILIGNYEEAQKEEILQKLEKWTIITPQTTQKIIEDAKIVLPKERKHLISKPDKMQSSIRVGRQLFTKSHPDYPKISVVNEIFGGYYGSRLMRNIREDKGYTYGIYSQLAMIRRSGYWIIGTDVNKELTQKTLDEIYKEAQILQEDLISEEELNTVRSYMAGSFAGMLNTPFELAEVFKAIHFNDLEYSFYQECLDTIQAISPEEIRETAKKYLNIDEMIEVVVGDK